MPRPARARNRRHARIFSARGGAETRRNYGVSVKHQKYFPRWREPTRGRVLAASRKRYTGWSCAECDVAVKRDLQFRTTSTLRQIFDRRAAAAAAATAAPAADRKFYSADKFARRSLRYDRTEATFDESRSNRAQRTCAKFFILPLWHPIFFSIDTSKLKSRFGRLISVPSYGKARAFNHLLNHAGIDHAT